MRRAPILALWTKGHLPLSETDTDLPWAAMEPLVPVLWQDGKDNSGWPVVCVPPGRAAEIIVTIEVCERTGREKKLSVVRQGFAPVYGPDVISTCLRMKKSSSHHDRHHHRHHRRRCRRRCRGLGHRRRRRRCLHHHDLSAK